MNKPTSNPDRWFSRLAARPASTARTHPFFCEDNATTASLLLQLIERAQSDYDLSKPGRWLRQLEACAAALRSADAALRQDYVASPLPLSPRAERAAAMHRKCYCLLGEAFSTLAHHLARNPASRSRQKAQLLQAAIVGGLQCGKNALLISQLIYSAAPPGVWQMIHRLYTLTSEVAPHWREDFVQSANPAAVYLHALLLGIASPETLSRAELLALDRLVTKLTPLAQLHTPGPPPAAGWYAITAHADSAPTRVRYGAHDPDQVWLYLDVSQLAYQLKLRNDAEAGEANQDEARLCGHLASIWTAGRNRRYSRRYQSVRRVAVVGLSAIQTRLRRKPVNLVAGDQPDSAVIEHPVMVVDDSPEGACLLWRPEKRHGPFLRVGSVVGVFATVAKQVSLHALGYVRWMKCPGDGALMAGIEWLGAEAVPVSIERDGSSVCEGGPHQPGLLLTGGTAGWREPRLLSPLSLEPGEHVILRNGRQLWPTCIGGLQDSGLGYAIYAVQLQAVAPPAPPAAPGHWRAGA